MWVRSFCHKVALYLSYQHIKSDEKKLRKFLQILSILSDLPVFKVKLTLGLVLFAARFRSY